MSLSLDSTHDAERSSWVASANTADTDFPVQNLPLGAFKRKGSDDAPTIGVAIGDQVLDLRLALRAGGWSTDVASILTPLAAGDMSPLLAQGTAPRRALRAALSAALSQGSAQASALAACLVPQAAVQMLLPCRINDYTDFFTGIHHATAVGKLFRPDQPLMPNYKWVPIGYHGRASTIVPSGTAFHRPLGQLKGAADAPTFAPCQRLDYELELGVLVGQANAMGERVDIADAEDHLFGMVLLNDWSARDIQAWEYQPLGPFLAKSFATTISPWVVTMEALAPFRVPFTRAEGDPQPLPYLSSASNQSTGALNLQLEVLLLTQAMHAAGAAPHRLTQSNYRDAYWTMAQLLTHHTSNGCAMSPGDLLGTGTLSGPRSDQGGSMLELSQGGKQPIALPNGETRTFLLDGDTIILRAYGQATGARRIGFGECRGTVLPSR